MKAPADLEYPGQELTLFAHASNWKAYWSSFLRSCLGGSVLEVGAGIGSNTRFLRTAGAQRWVCLEPDAKLLERLRCTAEKEGANRPEAVQGTLVSLPPHESFDTILYIDVLEHIEDDAGELGRAATHLKPGGRLVVLSPAHQWLFSPFDAAIGHYRRYTRASLLAVAPAALRLERVIYVDALGLFLSLGNRALLRQGLPTAEQIQFWDRNVVPLSRVLDPLFGYKLGKSILAIWHKG